ncbi:Phosphatidate cytidylyltransferase [gamma proteobacterium HdN1]|nr:Phosphatidate cytidylyltransferase [gamma proteobacterium HdN1]
MLQQRIFTALILASFALAAIFLLDNREFALAMAVPVLLGAWEWSRLMGVENNVKRALVIASVAVLLVLIWFAGLHWIVVPGALLWLLALWLVKTYPASARYLEDQRVLWAMGLIVLVPAWQALVYLQGLPSGPYWVLYVMLLVWGADTGAFFAGRRFGKRKLAPAVSPGKTIEGLFGGLALTLSVAIVVAWLSDMVHEIGIIGFLVVSLITVLASVLGDLFESMIKRHRGVKDSSNLLPGHGGVLDRIDSLTAAAPVFVAGLLLLMPS